MSAVQTIMKNITNKKVLFFLGLCLLMGAGVSWWGVRCMMNQSERRAFQPYPFRTALLSNGMHVFLVEEDSLPSISYKLVLRGAGYKVDKVRGQGLMNLVVELINKGTKNRTYAQVAKDLELLGASFQYRLQADTVGFSVKTLSWLHEPLLNIFAEIITEPVFSQKEFERVRQNNRDFIKRSAEDLSFYASRAFGRYLFEEHPYGFYRDGSLQTLNSLQLQDVKDFYAAYFQPQRAVLSVSGRLPKDIVARLEKAFQNWKPKKSPQKTSRLKTTVSKQTPVSPAPQEALSKEEPGTLWLVDHPAAIQSEIRMGHLSVKKSHPDELALEAANVILGGSMMSRLMNRLRTQKGLTYGVRSLFDLKQDLGAFKLGMAVRNSQVGTSLLEIMGVLEHFYQEGITKEELDKAKELMKTGFIKQASTVERYASLLLYEFVYDLGPGYIKNHLKNIHQLKVKEVNQAIQKHLKPGEVKILILSKAKDIHSQLNDYPRVLTRDYKDFL